MTKRTTVSVTEVGLATVGQFEVHGVEPGMSPASAADEMSKPSNMLAIVFFMGGASKR